MTNTYIYNKLGEKFTFAEGMIRSIKTNFETGVDQQKMPVSGPMNNQGIDIDGSAKTITITGDFFDTSTSVTDSNNIRSMLMMKYWFESFLCGIQTPVEFYAYKDQYSGISGSSVGVSFPIVDPVSGATITLPATFTTTKVYVIGFSADDNEGDVEKTPFTLTLWVAGL